ncbi:MAG: hypothetical protein ACREMY_08855 [bacterium]
MAYRMLHKPTEEHARPRYRVVRDLLAPVVTFHAYPLTFEFVSRSDAELALSQIRGRFPDARIEEQRQ